MSTRTTKTLSLAIKKMHWPIERNRLEQCEGWVADDFCVFHHDSSKPWIILSSSLSCRPDKEISKENPQNVLRTNNASEREDGMIRSLISQHPTGRARRKKQLYRD